jgi:alkylation response protein AidB-like acyl-CoA dehydrogenase
MLDATSPLRDQVGVVARGASPTSVLRAVAGSESGFSASLWSTLHEAGWFELLLPESLGGLGLPLSEAGMLFYEVGRNPVPGPLVDNVVAAAIVAGAAGRPVVDPAGDAVVCLADPAAVPAAGQGVRLDSDGLLSGHIGLVRFPATCTTLLVLLGAGDDGIVQLPMPLAGVRIEDVRTPDAATRIGAITLTDVPLSAGELIVGPERAAAVVRELRSAIRLAMAAETAGLCQALLEMSASYVATRVQFGRPVGEFQAVQQLVAEMFERTSRLCSLLDAGLSELDSESGADRVAEIAGRLATAAAVEGRSVAELGLQLHGGIGYTSEHDLSLRYLRVLTLEGQYGDRRTRSAALGRSLLTADDAS